MTEDISTSIRLGAGIFLLSILMGYVMVIAIISVETYNSYVDNLQVTMNDSSNILINDFRSVKYVSGANAYRFVMENEGYIDLLAIHFDNQDGTWTATGVPETLLENAGVTFEITIGPRIKGLFDVTLMEVSR